MNFLYNFNLIINLGVLNGGMGLIGKVTGGSEQGGNCAENPLGDIVSGTGSG